MDDVGHSVDGLVNAAHDDAAASAAYRGGTNQDGE
jgi:hypothetical protein